MRPRSASVALLLAGLSCTADESFRGDIRVTWSERSLEPDAVAVDMRILRGPCASRADAEVEYHDVLRQDGAPGDPAAPPVLTSGQYAFEARAYDADCAQIAEGCADVSVGGSDLTVTISLAPLRATAACASVACVGGLCGGGSECDCQDRECGTTSAGCDCGGCAAGATCSPLGVCGTAGGELFYVDADVVESGDGSFDNPWKTIDEAASSSDIGGGDTVIVRGGIYEESLAPTHFGFAGAPIRYVAAPGEEVVLEGGEQVTDWTMGDEWSAVVRAGQVHGVFQDTYEELGRDAALWDTGRAHTWHCRSPEDPPAGTECPSGIHDPHPSWCLSAGNIQHAEDSQYHWDGTTLAVRLRDRANPADHDVWVAAGETAIVLEGAAHIEIEGFSARRWQRFFSIARSRDVTLRDLDLAYAGEASTVEDASQDVEVVSSRIQGGGSGLGYYGYCLHVSGSTRVAVRDNDVSQCGEFAAVVQASPGTRIENNRFHDFWGQGMTIQSDDVTIAGNFLLDVLTGDQASMNMEAQQAISIGGSRTRITRNVVRGGTVALILRCDGRGDNLVDHNVIDRAESAMVIGYEVCGGGGPIRFHNNIVVESGPNLSLTVEGAGAVVSGSHNIFTGAYPETEVDSTITMDPELVDPAADDYQITCSSPARDTGTDFDETGSFCGGAPDIGAYELCPSCP